VGTTWTKPDLFVDLARAMERACFDYLLIEDNTFVGDRYGDSMDVYLKYAQQAPRQDPLMVATLLTQVTSRLGIVPTVGTFAYHPYLLARMIGTLDQFSEGRAGVNVVTGTSDRAAQNYGLDAMAEHDHRYEVAEDFLGAANALWDTWEPGAVLADRASGRFADHTKVHRADWEGPYFSTRGPLNSGPLPQGRPVVSQAGGSPRGRDFAARYADTIVAIQSSPERMRDYREDVRARALTHGRKPDDLKVLYVVWPLIAGSEAEAAERVRVRDAELAANLDYRLATMSKSTDIDFSAVPLDVPLGELGLTTNGTQNFANFVARHHDKTLRQAVLDQGIGAGLVVSGTPDGVAAQLGEAAEEAGGDGFLMATDGLDRRQIAEITDGLVPALQERGLTRRGYVHSRLRDNLLEF
jgi:FMN-dependent oxidoreductase (nitrilotriacetate monooxygenase family)